MPWVPGLETLVIKGLIWIGHHMSASALAHLASYAISHGVIATATAILTNPIVIGASAVIGGVLWTQETANKVNKIIKHLSDGEADKVSELLVELWLKDKIGSTIDDTIGNVTNLLNEHYDADTVAKLSGELRQIAGEVKKYHK